MNYLILSPGKTAPRMPVGEGPGTTELLQDPSATLQLRQQLLPPSALFPLSGERGAGLPCFPSPSR